MQISEADWPRIRTLFSKAFMTSFHYSFATVSEDGAPRVTPIGSLILGPNRKGFYFEEYAAGMARNLEKNRRVCILAVHASRWLLLKSLLFGKFDSPPAVRLMGRAGDRREATAREIELFRRRVRPYRFLKGHDLLWSRLKYVREIAFDSFEPVHTGDMTRGLWSE